MTVRAQSGTGQIWPAGLPTPVNAFVGRERELTKIASLLKGHRIVTLMGPGGVGKTRLAIELASKMAPSFPDGVTMIELASCSDPAQLWRYMGDGLGLEDRGGDLEKRLLGFLSSQRLLLLVDNCEHVRTGCAELVSQLLSHCPHVAVLATSRTSLSIGGEVTFVVPSLRFPSPDHPPKLKDLEEFEAAVLFLDRARAVRPGLVLTDSDVVPLTSICSRLDGIPLALELASARMRAMNVSEIAARLNGRFRLLASTGLASPRYPTLHASVEWSHDLLSGPERTLFRRLGVFAGGWSLDAAEEVAAGDVLEPDEVAGVLAALVDQSLVQVDQSGSDSWYRLLEVVRSFASERLDAAGETESLRARHGTFFVRKAESTPRRLQGRGQDAWAQELDRNNENLRAARRWCSETSGRGVAGLALAAGLWEYLFIRGRLEEATDWLTDALDACPATTSARVAALNGLGVIVGMRGQPELSTRCFEQAVALYRTDDDEAGQSRAWSELAWAWCMEDRLSSVSTALDNALAFARKADDPWHEAYAEYVRTAAVLLGFLSCPAEDQDDLDPPRFVAIGARLFAAVGDRRGEAHALLLVGYWYLTQGRQTEAHDLLRQAVTTFEDLTERWGLYWGAFLLAVLETVRGDWRRTGFFVGLTEGLAERTGGVLYQFQKAMLALTIAQVEAKLVPEELAAVRANGRAVARADDMVAAIWPRSMGDPVVADVSPTPDLRQAMGLTARELDVAFLMAEGLTNRQIGARLFIAERTVDTHVGHILAKTGCATRSQVAVAVANSRTR